MKLVYCAFGVGGLRGLQVLLEHVKVEPKSIYCLTYDASSNRPLLDALEAADVLYSTTPASDPDHLHRTRRLDADLALSVQYRDLVPAALLRCTSMGGVNLHPSLLPKYRGCFSVPWSIINGETTAGFSFHVMTEKYDAGCLLYQESLAIRSGETSFSLFHRLLDAAMASLPSIMMSAAEGRLSLRDQVGTPTYYRRILPFGGIIDPAWDRSAVDRFIRAMWFPPHPPAQLIVSGRSHPVGSLAEYDRLVRDLNKHQ